MATDFLVIRLSAIGDAVLVTPVFSAIRQQYPDARIHFITGKNNLPLFEKDPRLFKVYAFDKNRPQEIFKEIPTAFFHISDLQNNRHSRAIREKVKGSVKILHKQNIRKWLMVRGIKNLKPCSHVVVRYLQTLPWKISPETLPALLPPALFTGNLEQLLPETINEGQPYIALAIGSAHRTKAIPPELVRALLPRLPYPAILLGTPEELSPFEKLRSEFPDRVWVANGTTSLSDIATLILQSVFVITGDTAAMHLAASFQKPLHVVWGNTVPEFGLGPWQTPNLPFPIVHHQVEQLSCRPCSKLGFPRCPRGHFRCMRENPVVHFDFSTWASSLNVMI